MGSDRTWIRYKFIENGHVIKETLDFLQPIFTHEFVDSTEWPVEMRVNISSSKVKVIGRRMLETLLFLDFLYSVN